MIIFKTVLIVPLWNWNGELIWRRCADICVLIVPLWNWNVPRIFAHVIGYSSNRTFMELKLYITNCTEIVLIVLIVPLWNWNFDFTETYGYAPR